MFERYNEKARRTIFFARYEASQFGSSYIEAEFLLLALLQEDPTLSMRFFPSRTSPGALRMEIEQHRTPGEKFSTAIDIPLSNESKHVLAYAADEAERLGHPFIGPEHLLLGILCENHSFAATLLQRYGVNLTAVREDIAKNQPPQPRLNTPRMSPLGLFQLVLKVSDLSASIDFYKKLGFTLLGHDRSPDYAFLNNGWCNLRLDRTLTPGYVLSFVNADITPAVSLIQSAGLQFEQPPRTEPNGGTTALLRDPDGHLISLTNRPHPAPTNTPD